MPNIPYPEFNDFRLTLNKKEVDGDDPIEGIARLSMNSAPNCVKDILIACRCVFRYKDENGEVITALAFEEVNRNATPFDEEGIPEGDYDFPFSFSLDASLPPSVDVLGGAVGAEQNMPCKVWYEVRAYVMHTENHPFLERKHLRTSVKFKRNSRYNPCLNLIPHVQKKKNYSLNYLEVKATLTKDVFATEEDLVVTITTKNELIRGVQSIKIYVKQLLTIYQNGRRGPLEFVNNVGTATAKKVPVKRHQTTEEKVTVKMKITKQDIQDSLSVYAVSGELDDTLNNLNRENFKIASTCSRTSQEGIEVNYCVNIHFCVPLSNDVILAIPFVLSDTLPDQSAPPTYRAAHQFTTQPNSHLSKAEEAARVEAAGNAWMVPPREESESEEDMVGLPSYDDLSDATHKKLRVSKVGKAKMVDMRQSVFIPQGTTDHISSESLNSEDDIPIKKYSLQTTEKKLIKEDAGRRHSDGTSNRKSKLSQSTSMPLRDEGSDGPGPSGS